MAVIVSVFPRVVVTVQTGESQRHVQPLELANCTAPSIDGACTRSCTRSAVAAREPDKPSPVQTKTPTAAERERSVRIPNLLT
jgi:hypothetical protein